VLVIGRARESKKERPNASAKGGRKGLKGPKGPKGHKGEIRDPEDGAKGP